MDMQAAAYNGKDVDGGNIGSSFVTSRQAATDRGGTLEVEGGTVDMDRQAATLVEDEDGVNTKSKRQEDNKGW